MNDYKTRDDKRCLNCGHFVEERFCPNCGQENIEIRRRFHQLFVHFFEDFIHYDSQFWKTIKYLLFHPSRLTKEYFAGKRNSYVSPVKLYIFVSFIVFFIPAILPDKSTFQENIRQIDSFREKINSFSKKISDKNEEIGSAFEEIFEKPKKQEKEEEPEHNEIMSEFLMHNFPKVVFLYMPVFAFWLWLFHNKKKWMYFDHGIYTLHFFSFTLLVFLFYWLIDWFLSFFNWEIPSLATLLIFGYFNFYFFRSHSRTYQESKALSRIKCTLLILVNFLCISIYFIILLIISLIIIGLSS
jgi:hypothetical protein